MRHLTLRRTCIGVPRTNRGFLLLEVLVALLIFAFGVLGVVGLQAAMTKAQSGSKYRGDAAFLAQELVGTMWADIPGLSQYTTASCPSRSQCNSIKLKIAATLPGGTLEITQDAPGLFLIRINWTPPGEDPHRYDTAAAVRA